MVRPWILHRDVDGLRFGVDAHASPSPVAADPVTVGAVTPSRCAREIAARAADAGAAQAARTQLRPRRCKRCMRCPLSARLRAMRGGASGTRQVTFGDASSAASGVHSSAAGSGAKISSSIASVTPSSVGGSPVRLVVLVDDQRAHAFLEIVARRARGRRCDIPGAFRRRSSACARLRAAGGS